jgi:hypothetical protein
VSNKVSLLGQPGSSDFTACDHFSHVSRTYPYPPGQPVYFRRAFRRCLVALGKSRGEPLDLAVLGGDSPFMLGDFGADGVGRGALVLGGNPGLVVLQSFRPGSVGSCSLACAFS